MWYRRCKRAPWYNERFIEFNSIFYEVFSNNFLSSSGSDHRWHVASSCYRNLYFACQHKEFKDKWTLSEKAGHYSLQNVNCPDMFEFCIPQNGYRNQKVRGLCSIKTSLDFHFIPDFFLVNSVM